MDGRPVDALLRWLRGGSSRRTAIGLGLAGLLAPLGHGDATAKKKKHHKPPRICLHCEECQHCVKGRCRAVTNGAGCRNGTCAFGVCVGFASCPPGCPTCSACTSATSLCETQPNGQPGNQCASPNVCCNGRCCEGIHECNSDGNCATCGQACPEGCDCFTLSDGSNVCGASRSRCTHSPCGDCPVDLPFTPACVTSVTNRTTNTTSQGCSVPVGTGACWDIEECTECNRACRTAACIKCLNLAEGGIRCSGSGGHCDPTPCSTNADCSGVPNSVCAISVTNRNTNTTSQDCGAEVGTGRCWIPTICNIV